MYSSWPARWEQPGTAMTGLLVSALPSLYSRGPYAAQRSGCTHHWFGARNRWDHRPSLCKGRRRRVSYRAYGKGTRLDCGGDWEWRRTRRLRYRGFIAGSRLQACRRHGTRKVRPDRHPGEQRGALRPGGSRGSLSAGGIRQGDCRSPSCGVFAFETRPAGNVRAAIRRDPEYLQPLGKGGLLLGLGLRRGESGNAGADARHGRGRRAQGRPRECHLSRTCDGNPDVEGFRRRARKKNGCERRGTTSRISEWPVAGPRADRGGNRASCTVLVLGTIQRHDWPVDQRRRRYGVLLKILPTAAPRIRLGLHTLLTLSGKPPAKYRQRRGLRLTSAAWGSARDTLRTHLLAIALHLDRICLGADNCLFVKPPGLCAAFSW